MKVILNFTRGPISGQKRWLSSGQTLSVGGSDWSDVAIHEDPMLAPIQFQLQCQGHTCVISDQSGEGTTTVNNVPINRSVLNDGDCIGAGQSLIRVSLSGVPEAADPPNTGDEKSNAAANASPNDHCYRSETCHSGLFHFQGQADLQSIFGLLKPLTRIAPFHLIANREYAEAVLPIEEVSHNSLFRWLPMNRFEAYQPMLLPQNESLDRNQAFLKSWGTDSAIVLFSETSHEDLLEHLQSFAGMFCTPSVIRYQITTCTPEYAELVRDGISALLTEGDDESTWTLIGDQSLGELLAGLGFRRSEVSDFEMNATT